MGWNYIPDQPAPNIYPPVYPPYPPTTQPPPGVSKSEWREQIAFARAIAKGFQTKKERKEEKREHRGVAKLTNKNYSFVEILLLLVILGPFVGPLWNRFEVLILKLINGN